MNGRVLITHEFRAYRESLGRMLADIKPRLDVMVVEPSELDGELFSGSTQMVICGTLTEAIETRCPVWILLYPDGENLGVVSVDGQTHTIEGIVFADIVQTVDRASALDGAC